MQTYIFFFFFLSFCSLLFPEENGDNKIGAVLFFFFSFSFPDDLCVLYQTAA